MVAYSFNTRFVAPILAGTKDQTIRKASRKRHARPGEEVQLYTGMRTEHCRLIGRVECVDVHDIELDFERGIVRHHDQGGHVFFYLDAPGPLDAFARRDGFVDFADMRAFWRETHDADIFAGVLIRWRPFTFGDPR